MPDGLAAASKRAVHVVWMLVAVGLIGLDSASAAATGSLYSGPGPRPGPAILYAPLAKSQALQNSGIWRAAPILISGASAYRQGEFLYQDYLYDDHGANGNGTASCQGPAAGAGATTWGTYTYPSDPRYADNAADLVEVRVKLLGDATAVRITYDTMLDPSLVATTIGLGDSPAPLPMPDGANALQHAKVFVTVHGLSADAIDATTGKPASDPAPSVYVDLPRRQVTVRIPFSIFDPRGQSAVRVSAASGLWDVHAGKYLTPRASADAQQPGGAGSLSSPPAFFNVAFRYSEPRQTPFPATTGFGDHQNSWRDYDQACALASGDISQFFANVDFRKLAAGATDNSGVPTSGYLNRIMVTHFPAGQGIGNAASLQPQNCKTPCNPTLAGDLQPYAVFIPPSPPPPGGYAMTLLGHGCADNYNGFLEFTLADQLSRRDDGSVVATGDGRGACYWYYGQGAADAFEMWADVAAHYPLNPNDAAIAGYSMGGYYTYKNASMFPDLFQAAAPLFGCVSAGTEWPGPQEGEAPGGDASWVNHIVPSLRYVPIMPVNGALDPICTYSAQRQVSDTLDSLGYRYDELSVTDTHALYAGNDLYGPRIVELFDSSRLDRNPPHITYVLNGEMNEPRFGVNTDHAYWISRLRLRDSGQHTPLGTIDVFSHGFGIGDPTPEPTQNDAGVLTGGVLAPGVSYQEQSKSWDSPPRIPIRDELDITAKNISTVTIYTPRARVDCNAKLNVHGDGPIKIVLLGRDGGACGSQPPSSRVRPRLPRRCNDPADHDGDRDPGAPRTTRNLCTRPDTDHGHRTHAHTSHL
jgi:hypothetical protein